MASIGAASCPLVFIRGFLLHRSGSDELALIRGIRVKRLLFSVPQAAGESDCNVFDPAMLHALAILPFATS